jgi:NhaA family Na+:H+ antiporter
MQKMMKDNDKQTKRWLKDFLVSEASGGLIMIFAGLCALILANGETAAWYQAFIHRPITIINVTWPLQHWVNDVLMVLFFFLVGMELKRELLEGFLTDHKQVLLPLAAAIGGMVIPAAIYLFLNRDIPDNFNGWAIASATDIAFALCVLVLVGKRVPPSLKVFLLAIAIFDDLGAILIIAFFYSTLHMGALVGVAAACLLLWALNHFRVPKVAPYILVGIGLWFALHSAGIHTTIGGVLVALAIPMRDHSGRSPINKVMHFLHPWVAFGILPLFAFTSAGAMRW